MFRLVIFGMLGLLLSACTNGTNDDEDSGRAFDESIELIRKLPHVGKIDRVTEANDPYDLAGRSEGVTAVAVVYDSRLTCQELGIECGAVIEKWSTDVEAKGRSESVKALQQGMPMLGTEYHYIHGATLLRVAGSLTPSQAAKYEKALLG